MPLAADSSGSRLSIGQLVSDGRHGLEVRPPRDVLRAVHLVREHAAAIAFRPISLGNLTYLRDRVADLRVLRGVVTSLRAGASPAWGAALDAILGDLDLADETRDKAFFAYLVHRCDQTGYQRFWHQSATRIPWGPTRLLGEDYETVLLVFGPALGFGDEIASVDFATHLAQAFPHARFEVYSAHPALWRLIPWVAEAVETNGNPLNAIARVDGVVSGGRRGLIVFVNFTGLDMHLGYTGGNHRCGVLEVAIGRGQLWFMAGPDAPIQTGVALDPLRPNNRSSLATLAARLLGGAPGPSRPALALPPAPKDGDRPLTILVNPLTSKNIILGEGDWAHLVLPPLSHRAAIGPVEIVVHAGMTAESLHYAGLVAQAMRGRAPRSVSVRLLALAERDKDAAFHGVLDAMRGSDLVIGIDTFSSHLAALVGTPCLSLCYDRNEPFWWSEEGSLWVEMRAGLDDVSDLFTLLLDHAEMKRHGVPAGLRRGLAACGRFRRALIAARDGDDDGGARVIEAGQAAWNGISGKVRRISQRLDGGLCWPQAARALSWPGQEPERRQWLVQAVGESYFGRICRLFGSLPHPVE
ncbi:hypothetical protein [Phaeospirillum tilakii]|uniref:Glycosyltransferase family 9 (Heptosyltransferase) n=1 Tax=Phaeospirillum tilakii TaxID=741673 RepID=A0ABW5C7C4_9PROT